MVSGNSEHLSENPPTVDLSQSTDQVRFRRFTLAKKGYEPLEVQEYLAELADWIDQLKAAVRQLDRRVKEAERRAESPPSSDAYEQLASRLVSVVRSAEEYAEEVRSSADLEAERRVAEATQEARDEAEQAREAARAATGQAEQARIEADRILSEARSEADRLLREIRPLKTATLTTVRELRASLVQIAEEMEGQLGTLETFERSVAEPHPASEDLGGEETRAAEEVVWGKSGPGEETDDEIVVVPDATAHRDIEGTSFS